jgi:penicillin-binding protein 2
MNVSPIRLTVVQILVISLLLTLLGRLWYIQVLAGSQARQLAEQTSVRFVYEQAPRGFIFDRDGRTLARNRTALTVALDLSRVPPGQKSSVVRALAQALNKSEADVWSVVNDPRYGPNTPRPIATDVPKQTVIDIHEHSDEFPGVSDLEVPVREYPMHNLAAHVVGHIGQVTTDELKTLNARRNKSREEGLSVRTYRPGDLIGKLGVERTYEDWLAGTPGTRKIAVDVRGQRVQDIGYQPPERGWDAILTLDANLQAAAQDALGRGLVLARNIRDPDSHTNFKAPAGAVVAIDPTNGEILALASNPDFDPNLFVGKTPADRLAALESPSANMPFLDRAIAEAVPPGSAFKPLTAVAAWGAEPDLPNRTFECPGFLKIGNRVFKDWKVGGHGAVGLTRSLAESCDIVYYTLGVELNAQTSKIGERLQQVARNFGLGSDSNVDLPGEEKGLVPDANWKWNRFSYAQTYDRRWFPGDSANLAIGQGFLQATPLQLAVAYSAIANGGTVYRPHVLKCLGQLDVSRPIDVEEACAKGIVPEKASPKVVATVAAPPGAFAFIQQSLTGTVVGDGTAAKPFDGFPFDRVSVAGKTGTAQMAPKQPFSWFAAMASSGSKQLVVVALVEEGGTGSQVAAPIVRRVIEQYFGLPYGNFEAGVRAD